MEAIALPESPTEDHMLRTNTTPAMHLAGRVRLPDTGAWPPRWMAHTHPHAADRARQMRGHADDSEVLPSHVMLSDASTMQSGGNDLVSG